MVHEPQASGSIRARLAAEQGVGDRVVFASGHGEQASARRLEGGELLTPPRGDLAVMWRLVPFSVMRGGEHGATPRT